MGLRAYALHTFSESRFLREQRGGGREYSSHVLEIDMYAREVEMERKLFVFFRSSVVACG